MSRALKARNRLGVFKLNLQAQQVGGGWGGTRVLKPGRHRLDSRRPKSGRVSPLVNCVPWTSDLTSPNTRLPPQSLLGMG